MNCHGLPEFVIVKGRVCVDDGTLRVAEGHGAFLETSVNAPYAYNPLNGISNGDENKSKNGEQKIVSGIEQLAIEIPELEPIQTILSNKQALSINSDTRASTPGRAPRTDGQRNMQDSTFSISGTYFLFNIFMLV